LLSAGHDGQLFLWDIYQGVSLASFINHIDGQVHGGVFDAKWSPDGTMIAATDSHGHILMFGFGTGHERFKIVRIILLIYTLFILITLFFIFYYSFLVSYSFIPIIDLSYVMQIIL